MANQKKLYCHHRSSHEGNAIKNLTAQFGLQQIIKEPTHVSNTSSSCIDIITTSQPNWIIGCPVYTLHCIQIAMFLQNWTYMLHILHHIYVRSSTTEKQTQGLLDVPSNSLMVPQLFRWCKKLCFFYKVFKNNHPKYLFNIIPVRSTPYTARTFFFAWFAVVEFGGVFSYIIFLCKFYSQAVLQVAIFVNLLL